MALRRSARTSSGLKKELTINEGPPKIKCEHETKEKALTQIKPSSTSNTSDLIHKHSFDPEEISTIRTVLLSWYDTNKRKLQWRTMAQNEDLDIRAYSVWVSEVMLQQTQVSTVEAYYAKWMALWPTLHDLSKADLSQVHQAWAGLGYYSRATRLHEGAKKRNLVIRNPFYHKPRAYWVLRPRVNLMGRKASDITDFGHTDVFLFSGGSLYRDFTVASELKGIMPRTASSLLSELPGVGRYTAAAIASIAYKQPVGVVDGNVMRVLSRMRAVGADIQDKAITNWFWETADALVDPQRPGDLNQSLMELGATVCTPRNPTCASCPVQKHCQAFRLSHAFTKIKTSSLDLEDYFKKDCHFCLPSSDWNSSAGVMNFPRKAKKAAARNEQTLVWVVKLPGSGKDKFLLWQRPPKGLLASLWEFPSLVQQDAAETPVIPMAHVGEVTKVAQVVHKFSHINQTYVVHACTAKKETVPDLPANYQGYQWMTADEFLESAISTACKKVWKAYEQAQTAQPARKKHKVLKDYFSRA